MIDFISVETFSEPTENIREIMRYIGERESNGRTESLIEECLTEIRGKLSYRVCYREFPVSVSGGVVDLSFVKADSKGLAKNLDGCESAVIFGATVGIGLDRLISKYSRISPVKALIFQGIGAERIESLCDAFCDKLSALKGEENRFLRPRFSPGYGDLALTVQKDIFKVLDCERKIGLTLNESLLMSPSKSVTAIVGIAAKPKKCKANKCDACDISQDCQFRGI